MVEAPCTAFSWARSADEGAGDPADVDAAVLVEALVLDRDHRVLDDRGIWPGLSRMRFCSRERGQRPAPVVDEVRSCSRC